MARTDDNIFRDLELPPDEAEVMLLRAKLAEALRVWSLDYPVGLCAKAGIPVGIRLAA